MLKIRTAQVSNPMISMVFYSLIGSSVAAVICNKYLKKMIRWIIDPWAIRFITDSNKNGL
jgi:hypothetical protein